MNNYAYIKKIKKVWRYKMYGKSKRAEKPNDYIKYAEQYQILFTKPQFYFMISLRELKTKIIKLFSRKRVKVK